MRRAIVRHLLLTHLPLVDRMNVGRASGSLHTPLGDVGASMDKR